jgi:hypothetical protein
MLVFVRILAASILFAVDVLIGVADAADLAGTATHAANWKARNWHSAELIAGMRGANPLTVPFCGLGWYPGPVRYYGPRPGRDCLGARGAIISVRG